MLTRECERGRSYVVQTRRSLNGQYCLGHRIYLLHSVPQLPEHISQTSIRTVMDRAIVRATNTN